MHDLKFIRAFSGLTWPPMNIPHEFSRASGSTIGGHNPNAEHFLSPSVISNPEIMKIVGFLLSNMDRALSSLYLPVEIFARAQRVESVSLEATKRISGTMQPPHDYWNPPADLSPDNYGRWAERTNAALAIYESVVAERWNHPASIAFNQRPYGRLHEELDILFDPDSKRGIVGARAGMEAILQNALISGWTAFESCASDLWIKAVDLRPHTLARNVVMVPTTAGRPNESGELTKKQEPRILFSALADTDFNVSDKMGRILKEGKRVSLDSLGGIRIAYLDAFRMPDHPRKQPSQKLSDFFEGASFGDLKCLESIRNLFAHRGGKVDRQFKDEVEPYSAELYALAETNPVLVDGVMVNKYLSTVMSSVIFLLDFVADWLDKHPK